MNHSGNEKVAIACYRLKICVRIERPRHPHRAKRVLKLELPRHLELGQGQDNFWNWP
jgi:hypothetical protein